MAAEIRPEDLAKHPSLRKALGLEVTNTANQHSADDEVIPHDLLYYEPSAPPPIVIVQHGSNRLFSAALCLGLAILLTPILLVFCILGSLEPAGILGIIVGALAMYGLTHRRDGMQ